MLLVTGPFTTMAEVVAELREPVETGAIQYDHPGAALRPFLPAMAPYERLKTPQPPERLILSDQGQGLEPMEAIDAWVAQNVLEQELAEINSLLCGPCSCRLCCVGPEEGMKQHFFEIPLQEEEIRHFVLPRHESKESRASTSSSSPPLQLNDQPFFRARQAQLIHFQPGWSLIMPRESSCPNLDQNSGGCTIYPERPAVCRLPQIFAYSLERLASHDLEHEGQTLPASSRENKLLAIWDCPYVQQFQDEIAAYAGLCGLEPIFKKNKE